MDLDKINRIAFKIVAIIICLLWIIGGAGAFVNHQYLKGCFGFIALPVVAYTAYKYPPSLKTWGLVLGLFILVMYLVGATGN
jgi:hypothetical protein